MSVFNEKELSDEYNSHSTVKNYLLNQLYEFFSKCHEPLEGNSFYEHNTLELNNDLYTKQLNLFWCGKQATKRICEIGFNAGHSTMLMLLGRDKTPIDFTVFDITEHSYTMPCYSFISDYFRHIRFELIRGDSTITMLKWIEKHQNLIESYDIVHVDGGHSHNCVISDLIHADILVKVNGILILDDTNDTMIDGFASVMIASGTYKELNVLKTNLYPHRILQKNVSSLKNK